MIDHGGTTMKLLGVISTVVFSLTLGATALAYPQQEQGDQQQKDNLLYPDSLSESP